MANKFGFIHRTNNSSWFCRDIIIIIIIIIIIFFIIIILLFLSLNY